MTSDPKQFLCPECGSSEVAEIVHVNTVPQENDPWSSVLHRITCARCRSIIPAHLAQLWDNLSAAGAQKEWKEIYRDTQPAPKRTRFRDRPKKDDSFSGEAYM